MSEDEGNSLCWRYWWDLEGVDNNLLTVCVMN